MNANTLFRLAGLSAMGSGLLFIGIQAIHPSDVLASVTTDRWVVVHVLGVAMSILGIFGLTGIYARQVNASGWLGLAGYLLFTLFWIFSMAFQFVEAVISPTLATESPAFVEGILAMAGGKTIEADMGALPEVYAATGGLYVLGGLLFSIATFRAGILPRLAASSLAFAVVLSIVGTAVPHPYDRMFAVPMGLSLAWLGYALWSERREHAAVVATEPESALLSRAGAE